MQTNCTYIPYKLTGYFSKLVIDYIEGNSELQPFYEHPVSLDGIKSAIAQRKQTTNHRQLLVEELQKQYAGIDLTDIQKINLSKLLDQNTFTICTAHQPNIFTGHLYFIYKILHAIKLAQTLTIQLPAYSFVPVFYMGSEDADLDELGHINLNGEKVEWQTQQTGAVGRMIVDKNFIELIDRLSGELSILPFGKELINLFKSSYIIGTSIQQATLILVNALFKDYGLLILIPDNANLKKPFNDVVRRELVEQFSYPIVQQTTEHLGKNYKVQAGGREINLFYLVDNLRERIALQNNKYRVASFEWTLDEILSEVDEHPERFSANVILRGVFQEMILPNVAFIGGGGELAYWLELKEVFKNCNVPFPVLVLRNSFLLIDHKSKLLAEKLGLPVPDLFQNEHDLKTQLVKRRSNAQLKLENEISALATVYADLQQKAADIDATLKDHVANLHKKSGKAVRELEKKLLRSETKKFETEIRNLEKLKTQLFPSRSLQERTENFAPFYSVYGTGWIELLLQYSSSLEHQFGLLELR